MTLMMKRISWNLFTFVVALILCAMACIAVHPV